MLCFQLPILHNTVTFCKIQCNTICHTRKFDYLKHATSDVGYTVTGESASISDTLQRVAYLGARQHMYSLYCKHCNATTNNIFIFTRLNNLISQNIKRKLISAIYKIRLRFRIVMKLATTQKLCHHVSKKASRSKSKLQQEFLLLSELTSLQLH